MPSLGRPVQAAGVAQRLRARGTVSHLPRLLPLDPAVVTLRGVRDVGEPRRAVRLLGGLGGLGGLGWLGQLQLLLLWRPARLPLGLKHGARRRLQKGLEHRRHGLRISVKRGHIVESHANVRRLRDPATWNGAEELELAPLQLAHDAERGSRGRVGTPILGLNVPLAIVLGLSPRHEVFPQHVGPAVQGLGHELALGEVPAGDHGAVGSVDAPVVVCDAEALRDELDVAVGVGLEGLLHAKILPCGVLPLLLKALNAAGSSRRRHGAAFLLPPFPRPTLFGSVFFLVGLDVVGHLLQAELHHQLAVALNVTLTLSLVLGHAVVLLLLRLLLGLLLGLFLGLSVFRLGRVTVGGMRATFRARGLGSRRIHRGRFSAGGPHRRPVFLVVGSRGARNARHRGFLRLIHRKSRVIRQTGLPEWRTTGYFSGRHLYARVAAPCADAPFKLTRQLAVPTDWTSRWPDLPFQT